MAESPPETNDGVTRELPAVPTPAQTHEASTSEEAAPLVAALLGRPGPALLALHVEPEPSPYPAPGRWSQVEERTLFMRRLHGEE